MSTASSQSAIDYPPIIDEAASQPTWQVARLFPDQGHWTEADYFELHQNKMVELVDGYLEVLPMPTWLHQLIVRYFDQKVTEAAGGRGHVLQAPLPIRLFPRTIREPDVMYFAPGSEPADPRGYPTRVDLAVEVVSDDDESRKRDYVDKPRDYARAKVPEYWIVDPQEHRITVLVLVDGVYREHGVFTAGQTASGVLLPNLKVNVDEAMRP